MPATRVKEYLESNGIKFESIFHNATYTSQETAEQTHIKGKELAKAVILEVDGRNVLVVAPASRRADLEKVRHALQARKVNLADESLFGKLFPGCELGAMPPLGKLFDLETWADENLRADEEIAFNAGTHTEVLKVSFSDFERLEAPKFADLVKP